MYSDEKDPAAAIGRDYTVKNGRIISPGKFEGERRYMPLFYEAFLDGVADDNGNVISVEVTAQDRQNFPELKQRKRVRFVVREDGFIVEV